MARARSSSGTGWIVASLLLGFAFIVCLILAIILATQVTGAKQQARAAENDLKQFISPAEQKGERFTAIRNQAVEARPRVSVYGLIGAELRQLRGLVQGVDADMQVIETEVQALNLDESATLINTIKGLQSNLDDTLQRLDQTDQALAAAQQRVVTVEQEKQQSDDANRQALEDIRAQLTELQSAFAAYQQSKDAELVKLDNHLKRVRQESDQSITQLQSSIGQKDVQIAELQNRIEQMLAERPEAIGATPVVNADGRILTVGLDGNLAYINLSRADRIQPGMTFEVFDPNQNIKVDQTEPLRGKATIEVIRVDEGSSVARIVRVEPLALVAVDDQIVNLAYDVNARNEFYVHGKFDIDNIGNPTDTDNRRVRSMIGLWGGYVARDLSYQTDYLVLGVPPQQPKWPGDDADIPEIEAYERSKRVFDLYQQLQSEAERLKIPVLNQNRFLALVGHYQR